MKCDDKETSKELQKSLRTLMLSNLEYMPDIEIDETSVAYRLNELEFMAQMTREGLKSFEKLNLKGQEIIRVLKAMIDALEVIELLAEDEIKSEVRS